ncbi:MAG: hypothetical protein M0Q92_07590 [Methanoregula sp.]|jgi:hypothetical protein|nr:hypothetical protein [Methanoregula sp.]
MQPQPDNKKTKPQSPVLNPATDITLYRSPRTVTADNARLHRGTDVSAHKNPGGTISFYFRHWSMCPNRTSVGQLTTSDSAKHFIREQVGGMDPITGLLHGNLMEYLPGLYRDLK